MCPISKKISNQFQKNNFHLCYCLCCHFMLSPAQPYRQTIPNIYNHRFQTPENRHLKTTKTIIKGIPLNINVLIKMLELAKAMERNIPVLLMWRRPYGCIYIAHLVHLLICNFFAFPQEFLGYWTFIFQEYISPQFQICERMQRDLSRITELLIPCSNF